MEILKLNQVSYQYEKSERPVLENITCAFETGRLYCITGASGAGKSTLFSINIAGRKEKNSLSEAYSLLAQVGIDREKESRKILKLSGGEQQRVAIARAIAGGSPILAADEPTGNLDADNETAIMGIFGRLAHDTGKCVIVVTHSKRAASYADEVLPLRNGCLLL